MEEAKSAAQQQQQQQQQQQHHHLMQQQQQLQQQQMLLLQQKVQQQKQQQAISRFPSNIDAHLRSSSSFRAHPPPTSSQSQFPIVNPNPNPNPHLNPNPNQQQQQMNRTPPPPAGEIQSAYQDLWRVCHPDHKRPFSSLEDACHRLLPYHVLADYEAEEDDRILDSDTTGQMLSRSQQWDHNIAAKVSEFTATFEKQVLAFNIISHKRARGEFRSEERLMLEQMLLQEERRSLVELRAELDSRQKAGRDAHESNLRMSVMAHAEQAHAEMMARGPIRPNALWSQGSNTQIGHSMGDQEQGDNPEETINGWGNNAQRDEKEPLEDFLNDEETENGDAGEGEFDLNTK